MHLALRTCLALIAVISAGSSFAQSDALQSLVDKSTKDWRVEIVADGLDYPWDIERAGDRFLITEAAGNVVVLENGAPRRYQLQTSVPIARVGGGGLLGMTVSPDFENSGLAYFYHTYEDGSALANKVIQARFDGNTWRETATLISGIPGHRLYNGGRVAIGPDNYLYVTTGWTENRALPQDRSSLAGKVLRLATDGQVPEDNPFPGSPVYSLGHRNPQGIAWNQAGEMFVAEHGQSAHDEINRVTAGGNYGWPSITGDERREGMEPPWIHSGSETWAPSGIAFRGSELLVAALVGRGLYMHDETRRELVPVFQSQNRLRDVLPVGQDIYVLTTNRSPRGEGPSPDNLLRLSPSH